MKPLTAGILLFVAVLCASLASAGEVDPRFDGKWSGVEKFAYPSGGITITMRSPETLVAIAEHGQLLGILSGWVPGRYQVSAESRGTTIIYRMAGKKQSSSQSREECKFVLSPDGSTLEESGHAIVAVGPTHELTRCQLSATFHRQGK